MAVPIDRKALKKDLKQLAENYGLYLSDEDAKSVYKRVRYVFENQPTKVVFVVSWTPKSVGGFDWYWDLPDAERREQEAHELDPDDQDIRLEAVHIPAVFERGDRADAEEITNWLDGFWYDR